ncbi:flagellar biosynthesis anti-sigma factor FlgM [Campylobacter cuniculorum]|uniref:Anti-sigma factor FlgM n=2 Tax=Campylobacter cuniculorum TaxID=374106 RepID=A0A1W6BV78_9BACT|nr:flagellar biosynthesis anti-sigma factor FlgM [Campylobacter cuniculorum]ARJ56000.1 anti-sigma factor FlgM [Campylobacter cuniculorum DSM 23162 = LMG 24588]QOR05222.1 flagellar biosynthesis anti-sigma factor FlgM [Campylobacter cuniculorum]
MINSIQQSYVANAALNTNKTDKETKINETQKMENDKVSKIAQEVKDGTYKIDLKATASAMADSLI